MKVFFKKRIVALDKFELSITSEAPEFLSPSVPKPAYSPPILTP